MLKPPPNVMFFVSVPFFLHANDTKFNICLHWRRSIHLCLPPKYNLISYVWLVCKCVVAPAISILVFTFTSLAFTPTHSPTIGYETKLTFWVIFSPQTWSPSQVFRSSFKLFSIPLLCSKPKQKYSLRKCQTTRICNVRCGPHLSASFFSFEWRFYHTSLLTPNETSRRWYICIDR